ncbi:MAG: zinc-dependent peptidase [Planctomycetes bacterium]|nr:zinc-dependent peptidase [Planctomycetota bacterium]
MFGLFSNRRRRALRAQASPATWRGILKRNVPLFARLDAADQAELIGHMQVFLAEKNFEGCRGLEITEEIRVTIAAQACLLLIHREADYFPHMGAVLVYPEAYLTRHKHLDEHGLEEDIEQVNVGEAWERGSVILSWADVKLDAQDVDDGFNVVLHEFAHQLDMEDGVADGVPVLPVRGAARKPAYAEWARVMEEEFAALTRYAEWLDEHYPEDDVAGASLPRWPGRPAPAKPEPAERPAFLAAHVLDPYGAEDPAEFFAVATEAFFEDAAALKEHHPALYAQLQAFYRQDPAGW